VLLFALNVNQVGQVDSFCTVSDAQKERISIARLGSDPKLPPENDPDVRKFMNIPRVWPVVRFTTGKNMLCIPLEFEVSSSSGMAEARREQVSICSLSNAPPW
jgi:ATP-dependent DNA helicase PIF1